MAASENPRHSAPARSRPGLFACLLWVLLLVAPVLAVRDLALWIDVRWLAGAWVAIALFTFFAYWSDKRRAERGDWRIPESTLHLAELLGGWPGAFAAQRVFRHKTAKLSYQVVFWLIVAAHQCAALDYLNDWRVSRDVLQLIRLRFGGG